MTSFERFLRMLRGDEEIARLVDRVLGDRASGECAAGVLADYYLYYLFTRRVPRDRMIRDLRRCMRATG